MSSFPDVLSAELSHQPGGSNNKPTFTVPAEYAFAVVQVCLIPAPGGEQGTFITTTHGIFSFVSYIYISSNDGGTLKDFPILNLIIKGGESFSLLSHGVTGNSGGLQGPSKAKVTALCHKKPS